MLSRPLDLSSLSSYSSSSSSINTSLINNYSLNGLLIKLRNADHGEELDRLAESPQTRMLSELLSSTGQAQPSRENLSLMRRYLSSYPLSLYGDKTKCIRVLQKEASKSMSFFNPKYVKPIVSSFSSSSSSSSMMTTSPHPNKGSITTQSSSSSSSNSSSKTPTRLSSYQSIASNADTDALPWSEKAYTALNTMTFDAVHYLSKISSDSDTNPILLFTRYRYNLGRPRRVCPVVFSSLDSNCINPLTSCTSGYLLHPNAFGYAGASTQQSVHYQHANPDRPNEGDRFVLWLTLYEKLYLCLCLLFRVRLYDFNDNSNMTSKEKYEKLTAYDIEHPYLLQIAYLMQFKHSLPGLPLQSVCSSIRTPRNATALLHPLFVLSPFDIDLNQERLQRKKHINETNEHFFKVSTSNNANEHSFAKHSPVRSSSSAIVNLQYHRLKNTSPLQPQSSPTLMQYNSMFANAMSLSLSSSSSSSSSFSSSSSSSSNLNFMTIQGTFIFVAALVRAQLRTLFPNQENPPIGLMLACMDSILTSDTQTRKNAMTFISDEVLFFLGDECIKAELEDLQKQNQADGDASNNMMDMESGGELSTRARMQWSFTMGRVYESTISKNTEIRLLSELRHLKKDLNVPMLMNSKEAFKSQDDVYRSWPIGEQNSEMVQELLSIVQDFDAPISSLPIMFTDKATQEMYELSSLQPMQASRVVEELLKHKHIAGIHAMIRVLKQPRSVILTASQPSPSSPQSVQSDQSEEGVDWMNCVSSPTESLSSSSSSSSSMSSMSSMSSSMSSDPISNIENILDPSPSIPDSIIVQPIFLLARHTEAASIREVLEHMETLCINAGIIHNRGVWEVVQLSMEDETITSEDATDALNEQASLIMTSDVHHLTLLQTMSFAMRYGCVVRQDYTLMHDETRQNKLPFINTFPRRIDLVHPMAIVASAYHMKCIQSGHQREILAHVLFRLCCGASPIDPSPACSMRRIIRLDATTREYIRDHPDASENKKPFRTMNIQRKSTRVLTRVEQDEMNEMNDIAQDIRLYTIDPIHGLSQLNLFRVLQRLSGDCVSHCETIHRQEFTPSNDIDSMDQDSHIQNIKYCMPELQMYLCGQNILSFLLLHDVSYFYINREHLFEIRDMMESIRDDVFGKEGDQHIVERILSLMDSKLPVDPTGLRNKVTEWATELDRAYSEYDGYNEKSSSSSSSPSSLNDSLNRKFYKAPIAMAHLLVYMLVIFTENAYHAEKDSKIQLKYTPIQAHLRVNTGEAGAIYRNSEVVMLSTPEASTDSFITRLPATWNDVIYAWESLVQCICLDESESPYESNVIVSHYRCWKTTHQGFDATIKQVKQFLSSSRFNDDGWVKSDAMLWGYMSYFGMDNIAYKHCRQESIPKDVPIVLYTTMNCQIGTSIFLPMPHPTGTIYTPYTRELLSYFGLDNRRAYHEYIKPVYENALTLPNNVKSNSESQNGTKNANNRKRAMTEPERSELTEYALSDELSVLFSDRVVEKRAENLHQIHKITKEYRKYHHLKQQQHKSNESMTPPPPSPIQMISPITQRR